MLIVYNGADAAVVDWIWEWGERCTAALWGVVHGSETLPVKKDDKIAQHCAEMRMIRWMLGMKLEDK